VSERVKRRLSAIYSYVRQWLSDLLTRDNFLYICTMLQIKHDTQSLQTDTGPTSPVLGLKWWTLTMEATGANFSVSDLTRPGIRTHQVVEKQCVNEYTCNYCQNNDILLAKYFSSTYTCVGVKKVISKKKLYASLNIFSS